MLALGCCCLAGAAIVGVLFFKPSLQPIGPVSGPVPLQAARGASPVPEPSSKQNASRTLRDSASPESLAAQQKSRELTADYISRYAGSGAAGRDLLDHIRSFMQPLSSEHVDALSNLIKNDKVGGQEMASLIVVYGDQLYYDPGKIEIAENIKAALLRTKDRYVGNAAITTFSRLGPIEELSGLLKYAKANNFVSGDEYYGEIAHGFLRANTATQNAWLEELNAANNLYSREILAYHIGSRGVPLDGMNSKTAHKLLEFFKNNETQFSPDPAVLGTSDTSDYASWLKTSAKLAAITSNTDPEKYIETVLLNKDIDTRKTFSYFISLSDEEMNTLVERVSLPDRQGMANRLIVATYKHPADWTVDELNRLLPRLTAASTNKKIGNSKNKDSSRFVGMDSLL